jgi:hypothetical protein
MSLDDMYDRIEDLERRLVAAEESVRFLCTAVLIECDPEMAKRIQKRHLDFIKLEKRFNI